MLSVKQGGIKYDFFSQAFGEYAAHTAIWDG